MTGDGASPVRYRLVVVDLDGTARSRVHGITPAISGEWRALPPFPSATLAPAALKAPR